MNRAGQRLAMVSVFLSQLGAAWGCPSCAGQESQETALPFVGVLIVLPVIVAVATGSFLALVMRRDQQADGAK